MKVLILGGTRFVGTIAAQEAVSRGHHVTVFNRGTRPAPAGTAMLTGDRLGGLDALRTGSWDLVIDTWKGAPRAVRETARLLAGRAGHYTYVSSRSVYAQPAPPGGDESGPLVEGAAPDAGDVPYPQAKLGGEMAVAESFGDRALFARAGLVLGPYENVGRLPWWLDRVSRGGTIPAPGPADLPLQFIDARDLARFLLDHPATGGAFDLIGPPGHTTMRGLLEACAAATGTAPDLRWLSPEQVEAAGVEPWSDLPVWLPPGELHDTMHSGDPAKALARGLVCRPAAETVAGTWAWMRSSGWSAPDTVFGRKVGLSPEQEKALLAA
ncbi:NAD-dependent epimerase/dehydratase family protein [Actinocorallia populi]|uniref:NAD-dependent epimerase/dehydratase family protein n=1 Tax=Actinocorallia populi TaxID=2079200 RepID=UPI000D08AD98|nr:NAD-dependent epimerase/dehydratase family protein [Actinocorallia populi]